MRKTLFLLLVSCFLVSTPTHAATSVFKAYVKKMNATYAALERAPLETIQKKMKCDHAMLTPEYALNILAGLTRTEVQREKATIVMLDQKLMTINNLCTAAQLIPKLRTMYRDVQKLVATDKGTEDDYTAYLAATKQWNDAMLEFQTTLRADRYFTGEALIVAYIKRERANLEKWRRHLRTYLDTPIEYSLT